MRGALGRSGRKRTRGAARFLGGQGGFLTASTVMAAVGMAWGLYDSLQRQTAVDADGVAAPPPAPPVGSGSAAAITVGAEPRMMPPEVARVVRLAASAAGADGIVADEERAVILDHARRAGVLAMVDEELRTRRPLAEIVAGVGADCERGDLYVLAYTIVRADDTVSGAERIYLAQLAHALGLDAPTAAAIEQRTAIAIDGAAGLPSQTP